MDACLHRKPRARSGQVSSLQLDADDRIIDVIDVDHPFVRYRLHRVPTMALWYTLFIKVPTIEGIQTTLNAMGLLSALVLTICAVLPFAYGHDDYQQAIERWNSTTWISTDGKTLYLPDDPRRATLPYADKYRSFHERWATAFTMLSISLVLVVVLSAAISQATFREPHSRKVEPGTLVRWWALIRWVLMYSFVTLVIGIIQTCLTINSQLLLFLPRAQGPYPLGYGPLDMLTGSNAGVDDPNTSYSTNVRATTRPPARHPPSPARPTAVASHLGLRCSFCLSSWSRSSWPSCSWAAPSKAPSTARWRPRGALSPFRAPTRASRSLQ